MVQSIAFNRAADFYDETRGFPPGVAEQAAMLFVEAGNLRASSRIVEIGVGTGRVALPIARQTNATLIGLDLSVPMMMRLREKQSTEAIHLIHGDATRLPLADQCFDAAIVTHVFHLIPNWQDALAELQRTLKPDGVLLFSWTHREETPFEVTAIRHRTLTESNWEQFRNANEIVAQGWSLRGEPHSVTYSQTNTPAEVIVNMRRRIWSSYWDMPDEEIEARIQIVHQQVAEHGLTLESVFERISTFSVVALHPPQ